MSRGLGVGLAAGLRRAPLAVAALGAAHAGRLDHVGLALALARGGLELLLRERLRRLLGGLEPDGDLLRDHPRAAERDDRVRADDHLRVAEVDLVALQRQRHALGRQLGDGDDRALEVRGAALARLEEDLLLEAVDLRHDGVAVDADDVAHVELVLVPVARELADRLQARLQRVRLLLGLGLALGLLGRLLGDLVLVALDLGHLLVVLAGEGPRDDLRPLAVVDRVAELEHVDHGADRVEGDLPLRPAVAERVVRVHEQVESPGAVDVDVEAPVLRRHRRRAPGARLVDEVERCAHSEKTSTEEEKRVKVHA